MVLVCFCFYCLRFTCIDEFISNPPNAAQAPVTICFCCYTHTPPSTHPRAHTQAPHPQRSRLTYVLVTRSGQVAVVCEASNIACLTTVCSTFLCVCLCECTRVSVRACLPVCVNVCVFDCVCILAPTPSCKCSILSLWSIKVSWRSVPALGVAFHSHRQHNLHTQSHSYTCTTTNKHLPYIHTHMHVQTNRYSVTLPSI